jgi:hypothetical protein
MGWLVNLATGEKRLMAREWAQEAEKAVATVSSSVWAYDGSATLASATLTGTKATVLFTPTSDGLLTNTATFSDGQVFIYMWQVVVD